MKFLLNILVLMMLCAPITACQSAGAGQFWVPRITEAGGHGWIKGTWCGSPLEIHIWYSALFELGGEMVGSADPEFEELEEEPEEASAVAHCPVVYTLSCGVETHGALPIPGVDQRCFDKYGTYQVGPTYDPGGGVINFVPPG